MRHLRTPLFSKTNLVADSICDTYSNIVLHVGRCCVVIGHDGYFQPQVTLWSGLGVGVYYIFSFHICLRQHLRGRAGEYTEVALCPELERALNLTRDTHDSTKLNAVLPAKWQLAGHTLNLEQQHSRLPCYVTRIRQRRSCLSACTS